MEHIIISIIITIFLLGIQHYLSTRSRGIFGGIIPLIYIIFAIWFKLYEAPTFKTWTLFIVALVLLGIWAEGRELYKKKVQKELDKMKSKDI